MKRLFGTDGIRGRADHYPLTPPTLVRLGYAVARVMASDGAPNKILIGRDTRESGARIERSLGEGIRRAGGAAVTAGVLPTPGIAFLARSCGFTAGMVISASHNPFSDNGIKVFSGDGYKISDRLEEKIEEIVLDGPAADLSAEDGGRDLTPDDSLPSRYADHLLSTLPGADSPGRGLGVVVDAANGAASGIAAELFSRLGARVIALADEPNGENINLECGSLYPQRLAAAVVDQRADLGIAYDGDADRCILVDEAGAIRDGDFLLALFAQHLDDKGALKHREVVATVMSNLGLERHLASRGIRLVRTDVGDKYVLEEMKARGCCLGGEQSGHIIFLDHATTGDGILTSLKVLEVVACRKTPLSALCPGLKRYPQVLKNVKVAKKTPVEEVPRVAGEIRRVEQELGSDGRCLVRYSGTEALLRIMIEGASQAHIEALAERIALVVHEQLG